MIVLGLIGCFLAGMDLSKYLESKEPKWLIYMVVALGTGLYMINLGLAV